MMSWGPLSVDGFISEVMEFLANNPYEEEGDYVHPHQQVCQIGIYMSCRNPSTVIQQTVVFTDFRSRVDNLADK